MRVVVTGAGGFIGRAMVGRLVAAGLDLTALLGPADRPLSGAIPQLRGDIRDALKVSQILRGAEVLLHLAGPAAVAASFEDPALYASVHGLGAAVLFDAAERTGVRRAVLVSSAEIYGGRASSAVPETARPAPCSPYGAAKLAAEQFATTVFRHELVIVRPFSVYGPGMRSDSVMTRIIRQVLHEPVVQLETLSSVRDYVHVDDLAALLLLALQASVADLPPVLNAASGHGVSIGELARLVMTQAGRVLPIREQPSRAPRPADIARLVGDPSAAHRLGWRGTRPLEAGIADLLRNWEPCESP